MIMMVSCWADDLHDGRDQGHDCFGHDVHRGPGNQFGSMPWLGRANRKTSAPERLDNEATAVCGLYVIHGSDAPETAAFEIGLWFQPSELSDWSPADQVWRVEA